MNVAIGHYEVHVDDSLDPPLASIPAIVGPSRYKVVAWNDDLLALKVPGRHYFGGQGQPQLYSPASWWVLRVVEDRDNGWLVCAPVLSWPWRS